MGGKKLMKRFVTEKGKCKTKIKFSHKICVFQPQNQSDTPEILKYHQTKLSGLDTCLKNMQRVDDEDVDGKILCAYTTIEDTFPQLDNGSSLISVDRGELIGIAAWHDDEFPNVYIRIQTYLPWIRSVIIG